MTYLDVRRTCELLAYLGYHTAGTDNQLSAITVTKAQRSGGSKKRNTRTVFMGHVIGPPGVGKTTFCQGLLGRTVDVSGRISLFDATINKCLVTRSCIVAGNWYFQLVVWAASLRRPAIECLWPEQNSSSSRCWCPWSWFTLSPTSSVRCSMLSLWRHRRTQLWTCRQIVSEGITNPPIWLVTY